MSESNLKRANKRRSSNEEDLVEASFKRFTILSNDELK